MPRRSLFPFLVVIGLSALAACESESSPTPLTTPPIDGVDAATPDGGGGTDSAPPPVDAGNDATAADTGTDAGTLNALYAHLNQTLVRVNPDTGALTSVGSTGLPWIVLAWDNVAKVARVVVDVYSPVGGAATPKLGTIDLCTGAVTAGPAITLDGTQVRRAESLVQDPASGTWYVGFGTAGTAAATEFLSERSGTIDVATGAVTAIGTHDTFQDDADIMMVAGGSLYLLDVATSNNTGGLYVVDKTTGAAATPLVTGSTLLRVAYDPTRDVVFTAAGTGTEPNAANRSIGKLNRTTGANTPLGPVVATGQYGNLHFNGLLSAPAPDCK